METQKSAMFRKTVEDLISDIESCVDGFEVSMPKDEAALGEICEILGEAARRVREMDEARVKRKLLMHKLNEAFIDLERSQKQFVESVKNTP